MRHERDDLLGTLDSRIQDRWCITLDHVPDALLPEIADNEAQVTDWKRLFQFDLLEELRADRARPATFLRQHPGLVLDTRHFDESFVERLFRSTHEMRARVGGVLIHGENKHALGLLSPSLSGRVDLIYIDPPYNTGGKEFAYHDGYSRSGWITLMRERIGASLPMLDDAGTLLISCDDSEVHHLRLLMEEEFAALPFASTLVWKSRQNVDSRPRNNISNDHEYVLVFGGALRGADKDRAKYTNPDGDPRGDWMSDNMVGLASEAARPNLHYHILVGRLSSSHARDDTWSVTVGEQVFDISNDHIVGDLPAEGEQCFLCTSKDGTIAHGFGSVPPPTDGRAVFEELYPCPDKGWRYHPHTMGRMIVEGRVIWPRRSGGRPRHKKFFADLRSRYTGFSSYVGFTSDGTRDLTDVMGKDVPFNFPKPVSLLRTLIEQSAPKQGLVLDYFAGSGTTAAGVMSQNRRDGGSRRYVLVESGSTFDSVLLPRVLRSVYSDRWRDGVPEPGRHTSQVIRVISLEQE